MHTIAGITYLRVSVQRESVPSRGSVSLPPPLQRRTVSRISRYGNLRIMSTDKWATSKSTQLSTKVWAKLLLPLENALKLLRPSNLKFEPSPRAHTHSDPIINKHTEQVKNYVWIYHGMHWTLCYRSKSKLYIILKSKDLATLGFQKKFQTHPQTLLKPSPVSERSAYPLQNYTCFSPG